jgi:hypothetical protein
VGDAAASTVYTLRMMLMQVEVPQEVIDDPQKKGAEIAKYAGLLLKNRYRLKPDDVARWYFRLNGFLTTANFIVHLPDGGGVGTDADVAGIRFQNHYELDFKDDVGFAGLSKPIIAICEVATSVCKVNGPWSEREKKNIQYVLEAIGFFKPNEIETVAKSLYDKCFFEDDNVVVQMFAIGCERNPTLESKYPSLVQRTFAEVLSFIFTRFNERRHAKACNQQWDQTGQMLWEQSKDKTQEQFVMRVQALIGINSR